MLFHWHVKHQDKHLRTLSSTCVHIMWHRHWQYLRSLNVVFTFSGKSHLSCTSGATEPSGAFIFTLRFVCEWWWHSCHFWVTVTDSKTDDETMKCGAQIWVSIRLKILHVAVWQTHFPSDICSFRLTFIVSLSFFFAWTLLHPPASVKRTT